MFYAFFILDAVPQKFVFSCRGDNTAVPRRVLVIIGSMIKECGADSRFGRFLFTIDGVSVTKIGEIGPRTYFLRRGFVCRLAQTF